MGMRAVLILFSVCRYNFDRNPAENKNVSVLAWATPSTFEGVS